MEPQSRFGDKPLKFRVVCPQNGTAVLKGLTLSGPKGKPNDKKKIGLQQWPLRDRGVIVSIGVRVFKQGVVRHRRGRSMIPSYPYSHSRNAGRSRYCSQTFDNQHSNLRCDLEAPKVFIMFADDGGCSILDAFHCNYCMSRIRYQAPGYTPSIRPIGSWFRKWSAARSRLAATAENDNDDPIIKRKKNGKQTWLMIWLRTYSCDQGTYRCSIKNAFIFFVWVSGHGKQAQTPRRERRTENSWWEMHMYV